MPFLLPEKYHFRHQYTFFLHDILAKIVTVGEKEAHFNHILQIENVEHQKILNSRKQEETFDTLTELGYSDQIDLLSEDQKKPWEAINDFSSNELSKNS